MACKPCNMLPAPPREALTPVQKIILRELLEFSRIAGNVAWLLEEEARKWQREKETP